MAEGRYDGYRGNKREITRGIKRGMGLRLGYEDRLLFCFLTGITVGTAGVNLMGGEIREEAGYIGQLYETAFRMNQGKTWELFQAVFRQRILELGVLWFISITVFSEKGFYIAALWAGLSSAAVLSVLVCQKGVFGPFYYLAILFPQYLFYIPAWLLAASGGARYQTRFSIRMALAAAALLMAGIGCEAVINPCFLRMAGKFL